MKKLVFKYNIYNIHFFIYSRSLRCEIELYFLTEKLLNTKILNTKEFIQFSLNSKSLGFKYLKDNNKKIYIFN